jgi:GYF domain 2
MTDQPEDPPEGYEVGNPQPRDPGLKIRRTGGTSATQYFIIQEGVQTGPFNRETVVTLLQSGKITPLELAWHEGLPSWKPLGQLLPGVRVIVSPRARVRGMGTTPDLAEARPFHRRIVESLVYPFHGDGLIILICGSMFFMVLNSLVQFAGFISLSLGMFTFGYLAAAMQLIVQSSAQGEKELPKWPTFQSWLEDIVRPFMLWLGTAVASFGPGLMLLAIGRFQSNPTIEGVAMALILAGICYFPMAMLAVAMSDSFGGLSPFIVLRSMSVIPLDYLLAVVVLGVLMVIQGMGAFATESFGLKIVGAIWNSFNSLYIAVVQARILGTLYHSNSKKLNWF